MSGTVEEQALIVKLQLQDDPFGSDQERARIAALEDQLKQTIEEATLGDFDGDEFGGYVCTIYLYGPDADRLFAAVFPILWRFNAGPGSSVIKRYGSAGAHH